MSTDRERGVDRLIDLAERALAAGDEERAHSLLAQARVLSPGDVRIQRIFETEAAARSRRPTVPILLGVAVLIAVLAAAAFAFVIS